MNICGLTFILNHSLVFLFVLCFYFKIHLGRNRDPVFVNIVKDNKQDEWCLRMCVWQRTEKGMGKKEAVVNIWGGFFSMKRKKVRSHPARRGDPLKNVSDLAWPVTRAWGWPRLFNCNVCFLLGKVRELCSAMKECEGSEGAEKPKKEAGCAELGAGEGKNGIARCWPCLLKMVGEKEDKSKQVRVSALLYTKLDPHAHTQLCHCLFNWGDWFFFR